MKIKYLINKSIILLVIIGTFCFLPLSKFKAYSKEEILNTDYLKKEKEDQYIIGPGDTIEIFVSSEYPELNQISTIDGNGYMLVKKLNNIYVEGLTEKELSSILTDAYSEYVKYPSLVIRISRYRPIKIFIEGEVENPGLHVLEGNVIIKDRDVSDARTRITNTRPDLLDVIAEEEFLEYKSPKVLDSFYFPTLFDAIRKAGGLTFFSDIKNIELVRINNLSNGGGFIKTTLNFEDVFKGDSSQNIRVLDGDRILVKRAVKVNTKNINKAIRSNINPKFITVYINGRVNSPGSVTLPRISTMNDAILLAGGTKVIKGPINLISFSSTGLVENKKIRFKKNAKSGSINNPYLKNNNIIFVGNNFLSTSSEVIQEVSAPFQGLLSVYGLVKAIQ